MIEDLSPRKLAIQLLATLDKDSGRLKRIDDYVRGIHDDPYMPDTANDEYKLLVERAVSNWISLLPKVPAQALFVDSFRHGLDTPSGRDPSWEHWQRSRLSARQIPIHRGAITFGHSFTVTEQTKKGVRTRGLSAMTTAALFEDPANDETPYAALHVDKQPGKEKPGEATLWDGTYVYPVTFKMYTDDRSVSVGKGRRHGASECPVTRFCAYVDLEGRTTGVVEPVIPLQNRINQTVFDLLVAQTFGSTQVRYATGMAPPLQRYAKNVYLYQDGTEHEHEPADTNVPEDAILIHQIGEAKLDGHGNTMPVPMNHNASRFLFAEDSDVKFGSLDATGLSGFIESIDMSVRHLSAISQTPPHYLLGQIANLSAEALLAAETALSRMVEEFRTSFGESWERVDKLAAEMDGRLSSPDSEYETEVVWRDMELRSLAQSADGLGKLADQLGIPKRALWSRVPGVRQSELDTWERLHEEENSDLVLAQSVRRAAPDYAQADGEVVAT